MLVWLSLKICTWMINKGLEQRKVKSFISIYFNFRINYPFKNVQTDLKVPCWLFWWAAWNILFCISELISLRTIYRIVVCGMDFNMVICVKCSREQYNIIESKPKVSVLCRTKQAFWFYVFTVCVGLVIRDGRNKHTKHKPWPLCLPPEVKHTHYHAHTNSSDGPPLLPEPLLWQHRTNAKARLTAGWMWYISESSFSFECLCYVCNPQYISSRSLLTAWQSALSPMQLYFATSLCYSILTHTSIHPSLAPCPLVSITLTALPFSSSIANSPHLLLP